MVTCLRKLRNEKGLKRKFVAEKLGISADHLSNIERGCTQLDKLKTEELSNLYDVPVEEIKAAVQKEYV